jgi:hypothetical protein
MPVFESLSVVVAMWHSIRPYASQGYAIYQRVMDLAKDDLSDIILNKVGDAHLRAALKAFNDSFSPDNRRPQREVDSGITSLRHAIEDYEAVIQRKKDWTKPLQSDEPKMEAHQGAYIATLVMAILYASEQSYSLATQYANESSNHMRQYAKYRADIDTPEERQEKSSDATWLVYYGSDVSDKSKKLEKKRLDNLKEEKETFAKIYKALTNKDWPYK